nr:MAG TPA: hypothetical protein [Caudoviricetes sp.]
MVREKRTLSGVLFLCPIKHLALFCVARASILANTYCFCFVQ